MTQRRLLAYFFTFAIMVINARAQTQQNLVQATGPVGIGTTSPGYPLDVNGDLNINGVLRIQGSPFFQVVGDASWNGSNYFIGNAGNSNPISADNCCNIGIGAGALANNSDGQRNIALGASALGQNTSGGGNVAVGVSALQNNTTGGGNTALGEYGLSHNTVGTQNTAVGTYALQSNTAAASNSALGWAALGAFQSGWANSAFGASALANLQSGDGNVAVGFNALLYLLNDGPNDVLGNAALVNLTSGYDNVAIGDGAGADASNGSGGTVLNTVANQNIYIGSSPMSLHSGDTNEIVIGAYATGNGSNSVTLGNTNITSTILQGNVGIGTGSPSAKLDVNGSIQASGGFINTALTPSNNPVCVGPGNVLTNTLSDCGGTSTSVGGGLITQSGSTVQIGGGLSTTGTIVANGEVISTGTGAGFRVLSGAGDDINGAPWYGVGASTLNLFTGGNDAVQVAGFFGIDFETGAGTAVIRGDSGYVGLNTTTPEEMLEVNGNIKLTANSGAHVVFADDTVQSTAWNGTTLGGDYAESIDVLGDRATYEPGDVIAIDISSHGKFHKSEKPYSKLVAGIYSTKPGLVGRRTTAERPDKAAEIPMAMIGIAPVKVSDENGPIEAGDLLVSASKAGYAMKATDNTRTMGAVIGKALAPLESGSGLIEVLISLQ